MYRASCFIVLINQRDATVLMNDLYYPLIGSTCLGLSPVHHQERHLINCITHWYVCAGESSCPRNSLHERTNTLYSLWDDASDSGLVRNM